MNTMIALARMFTVLQFRSRIAVFYNFLYPWLYLVLAFSFFGGTQQPDTLFSAVAAIIVIGGGIYSLSFQLVYLRETNVLRQLHVAPINANMVIGARVFASTLVTCSVIALQCALVSGMTDHTLIYRLPFILVSSGLGVVLCSLVGVLIAGYSDNIQGSQILIRSLFYLFVVASGAIIGLGKLPLSLRSIVDNLPPGVIYKAIESASGGDVRSLAISWLQLLAAIVVLFLISGRAFRWDKRWTFDRHEKMRIITGGVLGLLSSVVIHVAIHAALQA